MHEMGNKMNKIRSGWGCAPDPAGGAYDAPPDSLVGYEGIGDYGAPILVPSALASAPRFGRNIFMSVTPPLSAEWVSHAL